MNNQHKYHQIKNRGSPNSSIQINLKFMNKYLHNSILMRMQLCLILGLRLQLEQLI